jgi:hypothetical protein
VPSLSALLFLVQLLRLLGQVEIVFTQLFSLPNIMCVTEGLLYDTGQFLFPCILLDAASVHVCSTLIVWTLKKLESCFVKEIGKQWGHTHQWRTDGHPVNPFCLVWLFVSLLSSLLLFVCNLCASRGMETWCSRKWLKRSL